MFIAKSCRWLIFGCLVALTPTHTTTGVVGVGIIAVGITSLRYAHKTLTHDVTTPICWRHVFTRLAKTGALTTAGVGILSVSPILICF